MPLSPPAAADSPPLPAAAALAAAGLSPQNAAAGLAFLRRLLGAGGSGKARAAKWRAALLVLRLRYERLRLGHDAQSLSLLRRAAAAGQAAPPQLSVGQWLFLLDFCRKNA